MLFSAVLCDLTNTSAKLQGSKTSANVLITHAPTNTSAKLQGSKTGSIVTTPLVV